MGMANDARSIIEAHAGHLRQKRPKVAARDFLRCLQRKDYDQQSRMNRVSHHCDRHRV